MTKRMAWIVVAAFLVSFWSLVYVLFGPTILLILIGGILSAIFLLTAAFAIGTLIQGVRHGR